MELEKQNELEDVIMDGHAIVLFYRHGCRSCNTMIPIWEQCQDHMEFLNPKWRFYMMVESKAASILNRLNVHFIPQLVVFHCPGQPAKQDGIVVQGSGRTTRIATLLQLPQTRNMKTVLEVVRPTLAAQHECTSCLQPINRGHARPPSEMAENGRGMEKTGHPGTRLIRDSFKLHTVVNDRMFNWVTDSVVWAQDPVQYWKQRS